MKESEAKRIEDQAQTVKDRSKVQWWRMSLQRPAQTRNGM